MTKKGFRFNIVDVVIILAIAAIIVFAGYKIMGRNSEVSQQPVTAEISFWCEEIPDFVAEKAAVGEKVSDESKNVYLGKITSIDSENFLTYGTDSEGKSVGSEKKGYKNLKFTTEIEASEFAHGIVVGDIKYSVGHTFTVYVGKAKLSAKISDIVIK